MFGIPHGLLAGCHIAAICPGPPLCGWGPKFLQVLLLLLPLQGLVVNSCGSEVDLETGKCQGAVTVCLCKMFPVRP